MVRERNRRPQWVSRLGLSVAVIAGIAATSLGAPMPAAHAAAPFLATELYGTLIGSSNIVSVNPGTGVATTILQPPAGAVALNQIGISGDGGKMLLTNATTIFEYTAATETWETTPRGAAVQSTMGGVDPRNGRLYFGGRSGGNSFTFANYDPANNSVSPALTTVTIAVPAEGNGDLAFDSRGNLYFASSGAVNAQLFRVDAADLGRTVTATPVGPPIAAGFGLNSLAFGTDGFLYVAGGTVFLRVNPVTGAVVERRTLTVNLSDLGSFAPPFTGDLEVALPGGRVNATDQFTVTMSGGGISPAVSSTTSGTESTTNVGPIPLLPGQNYTIALSPAGSTNLNDYAVQWACTNPANGSLVASGAGATGQFAIPGGVTDVVCVFTPVPKPDAVDDQSLRNPAGQPVTLDVIANDTGAIDPASVRILDGGGGPVSELVVPGEGVWSVNTANGAITFTPDVGFLGDPAPITYRVADAAGNPVEATVTVTYLPTARDDVSSGNPPGDVAVDVLANDYGALDPSSVRILTNGTPVTRLVVPGEGSWNVNPTTGAITFDPEAGFDDGPTPITYRVTDAAGNATQANVTISYLPRAVDDESLRNPPGQPVTLNVVANDTGDLDPTTVRILDGGTPVAELEVPGEGTWTVNPATGAITFTPETGFEGNPSPVDYRVADTAGNPAEATVTITFLPAARDDESLRNPPGEPVTVEVLANDVGDLDPTTVRILDGTTPATELVVRGEGTWNVNPATGAITFDPETGFEGNPTPIDYRVTDTSGNSTEATVTITFLPQAFDDESLANPMGDPVTVDVIANDIGELDPTTVRILDGGAPVTELAVAGEGAWNVNPTTGAITFTPEAGFEGNPTPIDYRVTDTSGNLTEATVTIAFLPVAVDDESLGNPLGRPVTVDATANDIGDLNPGSVRIVDSGTPATQRVVPGEGVWTVDTATGAITFTPEDGFEGNPTPVNYSVTDTAGNSTRATVTVTFLPDAADDESLRNPAGEPVTVDVIANDLGDLDPTTVRILDGGTPVTALQVAGEGAWSVDPTSGAITFTPEAGFEGDPTPIGYSVTDRNGNATQAIVTITFVPAVTNDESRDNPRGQPVTIDVTANDPGDVDPRSVRILGANRGPVTELTVLEEGRWTVDTDRGEITFTPLATLAGNPTPIRYQVLNAQGELGQAEVTVTFLAAGPAPGANPGAPAPRPAAGPLALTGSETGGAAVIAALMTMAGVALVLENRRRRTQREAKHRG